LKPLDRDAWDGYIKRVRQRVSNVNRLKSKEVAVLPQKKAVIGKVSAKKFEESARTIKKLTASEQKVENDDDDLEEEEDYYFSE